METNKSNSRPIQIRFAYAWNNENEKPISDKKYLWELLKNTLQKCCAQINSAQQRKKLPAVPFRISRMRAIHGDVILCNLLQRCSDANILIFDITERNPNVMLELGIALGVKQGGNGNIFILQEADENDKPLKKLPSDLQGYFLTYYKRKNGQLIFSDLLGFRSALLSRIREQARINGYVVDEIKFQTDDDSSK